MNEGERARYTKLVVRSVAVDYKRRMNHELRYIAEEDGALLADFPADGLLEEAGGETYKGGSSVYMLAR